MASKMNPRELARLKRKRRIGKNIHGNTDRPRLSVFRSDKHIYAQIINDVDGCTLASFSTLSADFKTAQKESGKVAAAKKVGELLAGAALAQGITKVVFDRNGFIYHGRVKALADGARAGGLDF
ncbi:MAG: 50S ribosomal protein L18 [Syntrophobacteraceae bacterium CG2_30_61_12]|nr:MAG: 50S ribosomal protein L18 [Syntrophobacteraceae bacterium CG2_30_61_12]